MRDTHGLRTRIALLACAPGLLSCSPSPSVPSKDQGEDQGKASPAPESQKPAPTPATGDQPVRAGEDRREIRARQERRALKRRVAERRKAASSTPQRTLAVPGAEPNTVSTAVAGDPPFIDGYNPEEDSCVSGNWCGAIDAVRGVAVDGVPEDMDCPVRISGGKSSERIKGDPKAYAGLSSAPTMQGSLNQHGTELRRAKSADGAMCCYHWFEYCSGRPLLGAGGPQLAPLRPASRLEDAAPDERGHELPAPLRDRIARAWLQDARAEHASVAAFARATLELMAVGAPADLLMRSQQASLDEIDHARRCFDLAQRYGAGPTESGPLPAVSPRPARLDRLATDTFIEGCVGETIAALVAERSARRCTDPRVADTLRVIADDEARHAALAWATVAWAVRAGGRAVVRPIAQLIVDRSSAPPPPRPAVDASAEALARHGRLDARAHAQAIADAWSDLIEPMFEGLCAGPEATAARA